MVDPRTHSFICPQNFLNFAEFFSLAMRPTATQGPHILGIYRSHSDTTHSDTTHSDTTHSDTTH